MTTDDLLLSDSQLRKLPRPSERKHRNFMDFIYTEDPFGHLQDQDFLYQEDDLLTLEDYKEYWLNNYTNRLLGHTRVHADHFVKPHKHDWNDWEPGAKEKLHTYSQCKFYFDGIRTGRQLGRQRWLEIFESSTPKLARFCNIIIAVMSVSCLFLPIFFLLDILALAYNRVSSVHKWLFPAIYHASRNLGQRLTSLDGKRQQHRFGQLAEQVNCWGLVFHGL